MKVRQTVYRTDLHKGAWPVTEHDKWLMANCNYVIEPLNYHEYSFVAELTATQTTYYLLRWGD